MRILATVLIVTAWRPSTVDNEAATAAWTGATCTQQAKTMKIRMDMDGTRVTATLDDNAASRDFISLLPLTLTLEDYNGTEKISDLPKRLSTDGAPAGCRSIRRRSRLLRALGQPGDFLQGFRVFAGLVKLGRIDSGVDVFHRPRKLGVTIQRSEE
jgi:hypothetical protein